MNNTFLHSCLINIILKSAAVFEFTSYIYDANSYKKELRLTYIEKGQLKDKMMIVLFSGLDLQLKIKEDKLGACLEYIAQPTLITSDHF